MGALRVRVRGGWNGAREVGMICGAWVLARPLRNTCIRAREEGAPRAALVRWPCGRGERYLLQRREREWSGGR